MKKTNVFRTTVLLVLAVLLSIGILGCPNAGIDSSSGSASPGSGSGSSSGSAGFDSSTGVGSIGGITFKMIKIDAVNPTTNNLGYSNAVRERPHKASISAYRIGKTEVTQELFKIIMGVNPSFFDNTGEKKDEYKTYNTAPASGEVQEKRPVENVNWYQAIAFCNKLSLKLGLETCYTVNIDGNAINFEELKYSDIPTSNDDNWNKVILDLNKNGFRLPTSPEWEWAAKGGKEHRWSGTDDESEVS